MKRDQLPKLPASLRGPLIAWTLWVIFLSAVAALIAFALAVTAASPASLW